MVVSRQKKSSIKPAGISKKPETGANIDTNQLIEKLNSLETVLKKSVNLFTAGNKQIIDRIDSIENKLHSLETTLNKTIYLIDGTDTPETSTPSATDTASIKTTEDIYIPLSLDDYADLRGEDYLVNREIEQEFAKYLDEIGLEGTIDKFGEKYLADSFNNGVYDEPEVKRHFNQWYALYKAGKAGAFRQIDSIQQIGINEQDDMDEANEPQNNTLIGRISSIEDKLDTIISNTPIIQNMASIRKTINVTNNTSIDVFTVLDKLGDIAIKSDCLREVKNLHELSSGELFELYVTDDNYTAGYMVGSQFNSDSKITKYMHKHVKLDALALLVECTTGIYVEQLDPKIKDLLSFESKIITPDDMVKLGLDKLVYHYTHDNGYYGYRCYMPLWLKKEDYKRSTSSYMPSYDTVISEIQESLKKHDLIGYVARLTYTKAPEQRMMEDYYSVDSVSDIFSIYVLNRLEILK